MSMRIGEESPKDDVYLFLSEVEGEGEEPQIEGLVRNVLVPPASPPIPPRSLRERCCLSPYTSALAGAGCLAVSVFTFVMASQNADENPLWSKIFYASGTAYIGLSALMFYKTYKRFREAV